jgi:transcriptional regulator with XRE-family HTH domain
MNGYAAQLGRVLRRHREAASLSQEELAFRAGVHRTYVGSVERGERNVTVLSLRKLAAALAIPASQLLRESEAATDRPSPKPRPRSARPRKPTPRPRNAKQEAKR